MAGMAEYCDLDPAECGPGVSILDYPVPIFLGIRHNYKVYCLVNEGHNMYSFGRSLTNP